MALSGYPMWWEDTITIYNKYTDPQTQVITWYKHTITDCFWQNVSDKFTIGKTELETNKLVCRIPQDSNFMEYYQWVDLPNDNMQNYFTLNQGDIIIKGNIEEDINEYQKGKRATDFVTKYKSHGCLEIKVISINIGTGKNNPHYRVVGI